jgi:hypothetical protein
MKSQERWMTWQRFRHAVQVRCRVDIDEWIPLRMAWDCAQDEARTAALEEAAQVAMRLARMALDEGSTVAAGHAATISTEIRSLMANTGGH